MIEIKSLEGISFERIYRAFSLAFSDYEVSVNETEFKSMLKRRGFNPALSFGAFFDDDIVAFTFNGIGKYYNDRLTAYDTGTGTRKEFRGQGLAKRIFMHSMPFLKDAGIEVYLLEVLQHNRRALKIYESLGFEIVREFKFFSQKIQLIANNLSDKHIICSTVPLMPEDIWASQSFRDFIPSWQNSFESIKRAGDDLVMLGAMVDSVLSGYCVFSPMSGDITQIAVDPTFRRKGIASSLLKQMLEMTESEIVKVINVELPTPSLEAFLASKGIRLSGKQFEMTLAL